MPRSNDLEPDEYVEEAWEQWILPYTAIQVHESDEDTGLVDQYGDPIGTETVPFGFQKE